MFGQMTSGFTECIAIVAALAMRVHPGFVCMLAVCTENTQHMPGGHVSEAEGRVNKAEKLPFGQGYFKLSDCQ